MPGTADSADGAASKILNEINGQPASETETDVLDAALDRAYNASQAGDVKAFKKAMRSVIKIGRLSYQDES